MAILPNGLGGGIQRQSGVCSPEFSVTSRELRVQEVVAQ